MIRLFIFSFILVFSFNSFSYAKKAYKDEVDALKGEVINAKTQMVLLKEIIRKEGLDGKKVPFLIQFKDELGDRYEIDSLTYKLDGEVIYSYFARDVQDLPLDQRYPKDYQSKVVSGPHTLEVQAVYKGNDTGIFSYLRDYRVSKDVKFNFQLDSSSDSLVMVSAYEKGWVFTDFKDRPQLKVESSTQALKK